MVIVQQMLPVVPTVLAGLVAALWALLQLRQQRNLASLVLGATALWVLNAVLMSASYTLVNQLQVSGESTLLQMRLLSLGFQIVSILAWVVLGAAALIGREPSE